MGFSKGRFLSHQKTKPHRENAGGPSIINPITRPYITWLSIGSHIPFLKVSNRWVKQRAGALQHFPYENRIQPSLNRGSWESSETKSLRWKAKVWMSEFETWSFCKKDAWNWYIYIYSYIIYRFLFLQISLLGILLLVCWRFTFLGIEAVTFWIGKMGHLQKHWNSSCNVCRKMQGKCKVCKCKVDPYQL